MSNETLIGLSSHCFRARRETLVLSFLLGWKPQIHSYSQQTTVPPTSLTPFVLISLCSPLLINIGLSSLGDVSAPCRLQIFVSPLPRDPPMPPSLSKTKAVGSLPVNFINPDLGSTLGAPIVAGSKNTHEQLRTRPDTHSDYCCVRSVPLKTACSAAFTHCGPLIHSFPLFQLAAGFGSAFQDKVNSQQAAGWYLSSLWLRPH